LLARRLGDAGHRLILVSRSAERGGALLESLPGERHQLVVGEITATVAGQAAAIALAVRARRPLITVAGLEESRPWVLDLSTPSAVAPDAAAKLEGRLLTLDGLGSRTGGRRVLGAAAERRLRAELGDEVDSFVTWLDGRRAGDAVAVLREGAEALRRRHIERLRARAGLSDEQLAAVEATSAAMLGELLHGPTVELRRGGTDAATVRRLFGALA